VRVSAFLIALIVAMNLLISIPAQAVTIAPDRAVAGIGADIPDVLALETEPSRAGSFTMDWLPAAPMPRISPLEPAAPRSFLGGFIGYRSASAEERPQPQSAVGNEQIRFTHAALGVAVLATSANSGRLSQSDRYGGAPLYLTAEPLPARDSPARDSPTPLPLPLLLMFVLVPVGLMLLQVLRGGRHMSYRPLRRLDRR
jgi:hypothetical protein